MSLLLESGFYLSLSDQGWIEFIQLLIFFFFQPNQLSALDLGAGNGGSNLLANLGAPPNLLPASLGGHVAQPGPNFSPIVSQCGPGGQAFTLLPGPQGTTLQTQLLPNGQILLGQQQQQVKDEMVWTKFIQLNLRQFWVLLHYSLYVLLPLLMLC